jgi:hypothetical protein
MASYTLSPVGGAGAQFFDNNGVILSGGKLYTYAAGTTTPQPTWTTPAGTTFNTNPIILNSGGRPPQEIWLSVALSYKFVLTTSTDVLLATYDNVPGLPPPAIVNDASSISYEQGSIVNAGSFVVGNTYMINLVGSTNFIAIGAAANIAGTVFIATGVGSGSGNAYNSQTVELKVRQTVSVKDLGATGGGVTDEYSSFLAAVNSLPAKGGRIIVPDGSYVLNTTLTWGSKSIYWDISPSATFSGTGVGQGKFPYMATNTSQLAVGPWIQSQSTEYSTNTNGGIAGLNVEMLQPSSYTGQSVAGYFGALGNSATGNVWAINSLIQANAGAGGTYQCIEVDVNNFSSTATMKGVSISGAGTFAPKVALEITRSTKAWNYGIDIYSSSVGVRINDGPAESLLAGIVIGNPVIQNDGLFIGKQLKNNGNGIVLQRNTDTSPTGSIIRITNAANTVNLFQIDVFGNISGNILTCANAQISGAANPAATGVLNIGNTTTTSATAGAATALPATPLGYISAFIGATPIKIPYYSN